MMDNPELMSFISDLPKYYVLSPDQYENITRLISISKKFLKKAFSQLDKAAKKMVVHPRTASQSKTSRATRTATMAANPGLLSRNSPNRSRDMSGTPCREAGTAAPSSSGGGRL